MHFRRGSGVGSCPMICRKRMIIVLNIDMHRFCKIIKNINIIINGINHFRVWYRTSVQDAGQYCLPIKMLPMNTRQGYNLFVCPHILNTTNWSTNWLSAVLQISSEEFPIQILCYIITEIILNTYVKVTICLES